jgi:hypothetical protein
MYNTEIAVKIESNTVLANDPVNGTAHFKNVNNCLRFYRENSTLKEARIFAPQDFSPFFGEKLPKSSGITHMVTSNGGHPLHHHLRHSVRLSNSLFNRRTTKPTFTQWTQASSL